MKSVRGAPASARSYCYRYLPINIPSHLQLRQIQEDIQAKLRTEEVILCEPENAYCKPSQARKILPGFRKILEKATEEGLEKPIALWSDGVFIIHSCLDKSSSLDFLGVDYVQEEWYSTCIQSTLGWIAELSENLYVQLLSFIADRWKRGIPSSLQHFPLFKFDNGSSGVGWASLTMALSNGNKIYISSEERDIAWLTRWNKVLGSAQRYKFMPKATQMAMKSLSFNEQSRLQEWLDRCAKITYLSLSSFSKRLLEDAKASRNREFIICVAHFLHFSTVNGYMDSIQMLTLCKELPVVTELGHIVRSCNVKLVPASMGKWHKLFGDNPWVPEGVVALSPAYMKVNASGLSGETIKELQVFMRNGFGAVDIPELKPPNAPLPAVSCPLTGDQAVFLLEWIQSLTVPLPERFRYCIMEEKWLRTHRGYESPNISFMYNNEWSLAGVKLNDLPFIDCSFYKRNIKDFENVLQQIGVVLEFGEGCETVAKILQTHTDLKVITRLHKYLYHFRWQPSKSNPLKIWIPHSNELAGEWKDPKMCVVHDDNCLFHDRLQILQSFYEGTLLPFFFSHLGVPLHPRIEDYCNLWLYWIMSNHIVTERECCLVWRNILKKSKSASDIKGKLGKHGLKFPAHTSDAHIQLCAPNETFIPDDLTLNELFKKSSAKIKFAWYPNPSDPEIPLDSLFSMYESLGALKISQAVEKRELSLSNDISLHRLQARKGLFGKGLYMIILGYLANPVNKLSADKRHQIVRALLESSAYESVQPFAVMYTLTVITEDNETEHINVTVQSPVRWEKNRQRILIQKSDSQNQKAKLSLATTFAEVISKGLLSEYPHLVGGLCEMLKFGCILRFNADIVNDMLRYKNLQIFKEDESFISEYFPIEVSVELYIRRSCQGSSSWGSTSSMVCGKIFEASAKPAKSPPQLSPDFVQGWENRLQHFIEKIDHMKDGSPDSLKINLVRMLFPSKFPDKEQPESSPGLHLMKVTGDACLKMLIVSEVLGAHESCKPMPFKLEDLLRHEVLKSGKCFGIEYDLEMLKAIAGAATLKFFINRD